MSRQVKKHRRSDSGEEGNRLRVLHVEVGGSYGGSLRALELYLQHSDRSRLLHDVLFYFPTPGSESVRAVADHMDVLVSTGTSAHSGPSSQGVRYLRLSGLRRLLRSSFPWFALLRQYPIMAALYRWFRRHCYDVIHVNNTFPYQAATLIAARAAGMPVVAHARNPVGGSVHTRVVARLPRRIAAVNRCIADEVESWCAPGAVRTCYDAAVVKPPSPAAVVKLRACLVPPGSVLIGSAGRLEPQKRYDILVDAAALVASVRHDVRFTIAGDGPLRALLHDKIERLGLGLRFQLCPFRPDIETFLAAVDVFVCSSDWEGGPLTVVEALLLNRPVVSTAVGIVPELFSAPDWLVAPNNVEALASTLLRALERKEELRAAAEQARYRALNLYDPASSASALDALLLDAVRGQKYRNGTVG